MSEYTCRPMIANLLYRRGTPYVFRFHVLHVAFIVNLRQVLNDALSVPVKLQKVDFTTVISYEGRAGSFECWTSRTKQF